MKAEKLSTEIAALERQSSKAKNAVLKKVLAKKIDKLKTELESITSEETAKDKIKKAKTKVNAMDAKEFNAYIKELAKNPDFSFLKSMTSSEIVRDMKRTAKPVGWRFRGRKNAKTPTKKDIKEKNNVYYEGRRNRSDVSRKIRLKDGGGVSKQVSFKEYAKHIGIKNDLIDPIYNIYMDRSKSSSAQKIQVSKVIGTDNQARLFKWFEYDGYLPSNIYNKGGGVDDEGIDLFEDYEDIPQNLQNILDKYMQKFDDDFGNMDYNDMADMHDEVYEIGYTFESGLDNQPYDLRPIGTKGKSEVEEYRKGGFVDTPEMQKARFAKDNFNPKDAPLIYKVYDENGKVVGKTTRINKLSSFEYDLGLNYTPKIIAFDKSGNERLLQIGVNSKGEQYAGGGGVDLNDWDMPVIRTQFEDEEFEYAKGGETGEPHRTKMKNMMKEGGNVEKYPELRKIADRIAEKTAVMINTEIQKVSSKMPYKAQWVLEEVIRDLESRV